MFALHEIFFQEPKLRSSQDKDFHSVNGVNEKIEVS